MPKKSRKPTGTKGKPKARGKKPLAVRRASTGGASASRAYRALLRRVVDAFPAAVFVTFDRAALHAEGNRAGRELVGMEGGKNLSKTAAPENAPPFRLLHQGVEVDSRNLPLQVAAREGVVVEGQLLEVHRADRTSRHVLGSAAPMFDTKGKWIAAVAAFVDVTDQRRTEEATRALEIAKAVEVSEERLRTVMRASADGFWDHDIVSGRVFRSARLNEMVGLPTADSIDDHATWWARIHPDDLLQLGPTFEAIVRGHQLRADITYRVRHEDGTWRWVRTRAQVVEQGPDGLPRRMAGVVSDVDEAVRNEQALVANEEEVRAFFNAPNVAVAISDETHRLTRVNDTFCSWLGYKREELRAKKWTDLTHPDDRQGSIVGVRAIVEGRSNGFVQEGRYLRKDGSWVWCQTSASCTRDASGKLKHIVAVIQDIAERRTAQDRTRALLSHGTDVVLVMDEQARVTFASANIEAAYGRPVAEAMGEGALEFVHPDDLPMFLEALAKVVSGPGGTGSVEGRVRHADGSWRTVEATGRNLLDDPAVRGVILNVRDVTEQRRLAAQLREAQKMESVGRLAGGVAHDFNNLLTVIMAGVGELKEARRTGLPPSQDLVEDLSDAAERARDLTRQLLLFARKQVASPVPLNLNDVVVDAVKLLRRTLGEDVKVVVALQDGLRLTHCDPGQASQVLINLAVNARDAMPNGGVLTIETENVDITPEDAARDPALEAGSWVRLLVRDTGHGITPEVRSHLFEPFFTTKPRGQGTGLGLATIHGIVTQSKGFIAVRSEPGQGSVFEVYMPRADASVQPSGRSAAETRPSLGTETVLVVDDEPSVLEAVGRTLRKAGYEVLMAREGRQALELKAGDIRRLHLLITDVVMPGLSGGEVAGGLRAFHPGLPVLFMSGFTDDAVTLDGLRAPNTYFIGKPFAPEEILERVREVLASAPRT